MRSGGVGGRLTAVRELWKNPALRRAELAWGGFHAAEWASLVALSVVAFEADGAGAVGLVLFARMVPSALVAPFVAVVGDRYRRERILIVVHLVRALACLGAAVALALDASIVVVYVLAVLAAVPLAAHRPSHLALTPLLVRTPRELAASNVAALTFESGAVLLGPALAALLLALSGPAAVFGACAVISFLPSSRSRAYARRCPWRRRRSESACFTSSGRGPGRSRGTDPFASSSDCSDRRHSCEARSMCCSW